MVDEHEKNNSKKNKSKIFWWHKVMSARCRVCNSTNSNSDQRNSNTNWICENCGNLVDADGCVVTSKWFFNLLYCFLVLENKND